MSTYDATVSLMKDLSEKDLLDVMKFVKRLTNKYREEEEGFNPYKPLTREEILEQLRIARRQADEGKVLDPYKVVEDIREKYGL